MTMSRTAASSPYLRARLRRLDDSIDERAPSPDEQRLRLRLERALNEALLAEAIAEAEQRCDRLARRLVAFDRRARSRVDRLRATGSVSEGFVWDPSSTRTPEVRESSMRRRRAERGGSRWTMPRTPAPRGV